MNWLNRGIEVKDTPTFVMHRDQKVALGKDTKIRDVIDTRLPRRYFWIPTTQRKPQSIVLPWMKRASMIWLRVLNWLMRMLLRQRRRKRRRKGNLVPKSKRRRRQDQVKSCRHPPDQDLHCCCSHDSFHHYNAGASAMPTWFGMLNQHCEPVGEKLLEKEKLTSETEQSTEKRPSKGEKSLNAQVPNTKMGLKISPGCDG